MDREWNSLQQKHMRATQGMVAHMSFCWGHPSLIALEVGWRWLFGIPFLLVLWAQAQRILVVIPPATTGLDRLEWQNPWLSSALLAEAISRYEPAVMAVLHWLAPVALVAWAVIAGLGRTLILVRMMRLDGESGERKRSVWGLLPGMMGLQGLWMVALLGCFWAWYRVVGWAAATYLTAGSEPELIGYLCWLIGISLAIYTVWALVSWTLAFAPVLYFLEGEAGVQASFRALIRSFVQGRELSGKLLEINLVMAIVKIMLIVLDMVFSAAPLPFSDQFGPDALHVLYVGIFVLFLVGNDYFHVVRVRSFVGLWRYYRGGTIARAIEFAPDTEIRKYADYQQEFASKIFGIDGWLVTDESSLWDFTSESSLEPVYSKIRREYGIEVDDIQGALLWKIFRRIANRS